KKAAFRSQVWLEYRRVLVRSGYALTISAEGADSGLIDSASGKKVLLHETAGGVVVGYVEGTDPNVAANQVFTLSVDGSGHVTLRSEERGVGREGEGPEGRDEA